MMMIPAEVVCRVECLFLPVHTLREVSVERLEKGLR